MDRAKFVPRPVKDQYPMEMWVFGSAVGIFMLAILSDHIFKNRLFFTPIAVCLGVQIMIEIGIFIAVCLNPELKQHSQPILFIQGFVESSM